MKRRQQVERRAVRRSVPEELPADRPELDNRTRRLLARLDGRD